MLRLRAHKAITIRSRSLSQLIQIPLIFTGLLATLWTWKSLTLILFQRRIVYMPYIGRHERIQDHRTYGVTWEEHTVRTSDGKTIVLCESNLGSLGKPKVTIVYLQGNAGSTPPRLPHLSNLLRDMRPDFDATIWTVSYRGFWKSTGTPSEAGCLLDIQAALKYIDCQDHLVIWGHSIGAGFTVLSLPYVESLQLRTSIILETPFVSTMTLLKHIYPQRWLPYRYLSPFLTTRLDMRRIQIPSRMNLLIIQAEKDEIVPRMESDAVYDLCRASGGHVKRTVIMNGLHMDCIGKAQLRQDITTFIKGRMD